MKSAFAGIAAAVLLASGLAGAPAQAADEVKIGFLTTLSGPVGAIGAEVRDGFLLALKHAGDKFGGLPVKLSVVDDAQNPQSARQTVEQFLKRDKVDIITGGVFSNVVLPVLPGILQANTVYLSTNTGPMDYAADKCNPNFFALAWQNEDIPAAMGKYANEQGYKRVAMIAPDYPGGRESLEGFKREYKGEVAEEIYTKLGQLDYAAELATMRMAKPDAVFFFLPGGMGVNFIKQYDGAGLNKTVPLLAPGFSADEDTIKAVGEAIVGLHNASQWAADLDTPANKRFVADFIKAYGRVPTMYASQGYDTGMLIDSAVRKTGGHVEDKESLRKALRAADFTSVRGSFRFNVNQYPIQDIYMRVVEKTAQGQITNKTIGVVMKDKADRFAAQCRMPAG